jgi:polysaccharide export outer membrane protein
VKATAFLIGLLLVAGQALWAQPPPDSGRFTVPGKEEYFLDPATQKLSIEVHLWGEVAKPGVFRVPLGTNVLELISLAGGPTEYSNLSKVKLTRRASGGTASIVETVDLARYTDAKGNPLIPMLAPGDLITVPRNFRHAWERSIKLVGDIVIVANLIFLISQIKK